MTQTTTTTAADIYAAALAEGRAPHEALALAASALRG